MNADDWTAVAAIAVFSGLLLAAVLYLMHASIWPGGQGRHQQRHQKPLRGVARALAACLDPDDAAPTILPPGSAGAGRELDLGEVPPVALPPGLPAVRPADCTQCRDLGFLGGCGGCGRKPAMVRPARINGSAVRR